MALSPGEQLGNYKIVSLVGKGGMGEVYLGTDMRLDRPVAIKLSSREFNDRFERESKAISSLNHPNICTLYDVGPNYLVMELVEGETLSAIIGRGPLPLDQALKYAIQIVDALAAAHAKGVIHRDLKPGNIVITKNGAKVLDFGLAKLASERVPSNSDSIVTAMEPITKTGSVLGTLYYMAPEQVEGKDTDERSDIFSFGVVFYEMITGQRPFTGDTQAAVLASLLKDQPQSMNQRIPAVPRALERVVRKCLEKKSEDRWHSARDLKPTLELIDLDAPPSNLSSSSTTIPVQTPRKNWLWPAVVAAVVLALGAGGTFAYLNREIPVPDAIRFEIGLPGSGGLGGAAVSPDGRMLAFVARNAEGQTKLWVRSLSTSEAHPLDGTEGVLGLPFWSWDSRYIAFGSAADAKLKKIEAVGGPAQTLCTVSATVAGGIWTSDGKIVFGQSNPAPTNQVSASGGTATAVPHESVILASPSLLPDGKHFLFSGGDGIYLASLEEGSKEMPRRILEDNSAVAYTPTPHSKNGYVLFVRGTSNTGVAATGTLMAQPFDPRSNQIAGDAIPIAENVTPTGFSVSQTGVLMHSRNSATAGSSQTGTVGVLTWLDRAGKVLSTVGEVKSYSLNVNLSPDSKRVVTSHDGDLYVFEFERGVESRLTFEPGPEITSYWRPDGSRIVYAKTNPVAIYEKASNGAGSPELFFTVPKELGTVFASEWTPDGRYLAVAPGGAINGDIQLLPAEGTAETRKLMPLLKTPFNERGARFASSGNFFAYTSNESGKEEAYVRPFDPQTGTSPGGQWLVSKGGGVSPHWRGDGKEMFYMSLDGGMMAVDIDTKSGFQPGTPKQLFKMPGEVRFWDVTRDGQKFLIPVAQSAANSAPYNVIVNWTSTLKK